MKYFLLTFACLAAILISPRAYADQEASAVLNMRVAIIQCGSRDNIQKACEMNSACCVFIKDDAVDNVPFEVAELEQNIQSCTPSFTGRGGLYNPICESTME